MRLTTPDAVRHRIASEWLRADMASPVLGSVTLRPHQVDAVRRLRALLERTEGALLCDEVGLGKTYVALAIAQSRARTLVVAPASLREMWRDASVRSGVTIQFISTESLSRAPPSRFEHDLVIVDEAHHFRTVATARHRALAALTARSPVLLVSATPLHNRRNDLTALLSLFLGSAACGLSDEHVAGYLVRRNPDDMVDAFPRVGDPVHLSIPHDSRQLHSLLTLPPPTPPRDGGFAAAMVAHTLVRLWASSDAALREGLRRRLARTTAIRCALESGTYPTARELRAWTYAEGSMQLGFGSLLSPDAYDHCEQLLDPVRCHERALVDLLASLPRDSSADAARAEHIRSLRRRHPDVKIIAFSQFAETVGMFYRRLAREPGVAMLTSRGARIASGPVSRSEALALFAPVSASGTSGGRRTEISLLLATDLLSEGVNLQNAAVVVHLDLPWTAATLEQRVGRVARMGSPHREVFVYSITPPAPTRDLLKAEAIIRRKAMLAATNIGSSRIPPLFARAATSGGSEVEDAEAIRRTLTGWLGCERPENESAPLCAAVAADRNGALVLVTVRGESRLLATNSGEMSSSLSAVRHVAELASAQPARVPSASIARIVEKAGRWIEAELASADAGQASTGRSLLVRPVGKRLAKLLASCPRHQRAQCSIRIAAMHHRLQLPFTFGIERKIERALAAVPPDDFLETLERIVGAPRTEEKDKDSNVRAVLILQPSLTAATSA